MPRCSSHVQITLKPGHRDNPPAPDWRRQLFISFFFFQYIKQKLFLTTFNTMLPFVGLWRHIYRAAKDHQDHAGVCWQGFHLHLHPGDASKVGCLWFPNVFYQCLVLAGLPDCWCEYSEVPSSISWQGTMSIGPGCGQQYGAGTLGNTDLVQIQVLFSNSPVELYLRHILSI